MTRKNKSNLRVLSLALALLMLLCLAPISSPAEAAGETLSISTEKEFKNFIKMCSIDSYSKNLSVKLTSDIDLGGSSINPVPIFFGSFDGNGHKISNFIIKIKGSEIGLFRSVELGAEVKNLTLEGTVTPKGSACCIGLLAGENRGVISGCTVSGTVSGETDIGGLVGINQAKGRISACSLDVTVSGKLRTGGIVGSNFGTIESSTFKGSVNTNAGEGVSAPGLSDITNLTDIVSNSVSDAVSDAVTGSQPSSDDREEALSSDISNTGGIAGRNEGALRGCTNRGAVGYPHVGYNTGGIAGSHNGIISACENYGTILGRKDVGGIVGQFEPDMAITFGANSGAELENQISALTSTLRSLTDALSSSADSALTSADDINKAVGIIENTLKGHADAAGEEIDLTLDRLYGNLQIINTAAEKINAAAADFNTVATAEMPIITSEFETISVALEEAKVSAEVSSILSQIDNINAQITVISNALAGLETLISGISSDLQNTEITDKRAAISARLTAYYESVDKNAISNALSGIASSMDTISAKLKTINSKLSKSSAVIINSMQLISSSAARLQKAFTSLTGSVTTQAAIINANIDKIETLLYGYSGSAADRLDQTFDTVYIQLNTINAGLDDIIKTADATNVEVYTLLNTSIDQLNSIGQSVSALMDPPQYSTVDVSENIEQEEKPGQISSSRNSGPVAADANVGGIAGIMALEMSSDPEEDYSMQDGLWVDTTALFRAIVMTSSNSASVTAKNSCSGGAVGRCDLGAVYKAENQGAVEATGGNYCGGIVGRSMGSIIACDSLCDLTGNDYVGGIAGLGKNLSGNRSMVRIKSEGECLGAVAGNADGDIVDNAFVEEELQAIDGISYAGIAYPMPYEDFINLEFINPIFSDLHADFYVDEKLVKRLSLTYGGSIRSFEIPPIPRREDSFGVWEPFETENTLRSQRINAVFSPWITTLSSGGELPLMLAEGEFSNAAVLEVEDTTPKIKLGGTNKVLYTFSYSLSDPSAPSAEEYLFHLRCEKTGDISVSLTKGSEAQILPCRRDGNYLVFKAPAKGELIVKESQAKKIVLAVFIILAVLILLAFFIYLQKHFPKEKTDASEKSISNKKEKLPHNSSKRQKNQKNQKNQKKLKKGQKAAKKAPKVPKTKKSKKTPVSQGFEPSLDDVSAETDEFSSSDVSAETQKPSPAFKGDKKPAPPLKHTWPPADLLEESSPPAAEKPRLNIVIDDDGIDRKI